MEEGGRPFREPRGSRSSQPSKRFPPQSPSFGHPCAQVWDTAGQERFRTISISFLRGAQGIALVFDLTDRKSFDNIRQWMSQVSDSTDGSISMVLLANKADATDRRAVSDDEIHEVAKKLNVPVFFTSAKSGANVAESFGTLASLATKKVLESTAPGAAAAAQGGGQDLKSKPAGGGGGGGGCC